MAVYAFTDRTPTQRFDPLSPCHIDRVLTICSGMSKTVFELLLVCGCMKYGITVTSGGQDGQDDFDVAQGNRLPWHELRRYFDLPKPVPINVHHERVVSPDESTPLIAVWLISSAGPSLTEKPPADYCPARHGYTCQLALSL